MVGGRFADPAGSVKNAAWEKPKECIPVPLGKRQTQPAAGGSGALARCATPG